MTRRLTAYARGSEWRLEVVHARPPTFRHDLSGGSSSSRPQAGCCCWHSRWRTADMVLELRFSTDSRRADLLATTSLVRRRVVEAFSDAGLPLPEPDLRRVELQSDRSA